MTLQCVYYYSQILLTVIAAVAAAAAYQQLQTFKRFELLKILEDPRVRRARRVLFQKLRTGNESPPLWWQNDDELEEAASTVAAAFDIVGLMATGANRRFFRTQWTHPICWTYEVLEKYLEDRNPTGYQGYRSLYQEARPLRPPTTPSN